MLFFLEQNWLLITILGVGTILSILWVYFFNKEELNLRLWQAIVAVISATAIGVLALRFFALLEGGFDPSKAGQLSFFGGIFVLPLFAFVFSKIKKVPMTKVLDVFTVVLIILSFGRINCLVAGCCYGKYIGYSEIRYPTREIELVYDAIILVISIIFIRKNILSKRIYFLHLMAYGLLRFIIEFMRYSESGDVFHIGHLWAALSFIVGTSFFIYFTIKERKENK